MSWLWKGILHGIEGARGRLAFDGRDVDARHDAAGANVLDDRQVLQVAVRRVGKHTSSCAAFS
jgi:hypothetical protein